MDQQEMMEDQKNWENEFNKKEKYANLTPISFEELTEVFNKWLLIEDKGILKIVCATVVANQLPTNAVWLFIVAPSGGGKTEFIKALGEIEFIYPLSNLTPQTFISGMRGQDASLLPQLTNKIVTFKDFTTILQSHPQAQAEILAQLREIYDGHFKKDFGTGARKEWKGKIGFIAGVTGVIDRYHNVHKSLGERFLQYRVSQPDRMEVMDRVEKNTLLKEKMDEELSLAMAQFIKGIEIPKELPPIPDEMRTGMKKVARFVSTARSAVIRGGKNNEIEFVPDTEMSTRIYSQMYVMALALMLVNQDKSLKPEDYKILFKLGFDSIHALRRGILEVLREYRDWVRTDTIATKVKYSTPTTRNHLEELVALGIVERMKPHEKKIIWRLTEEYRQIWHEGELEHNPNVDGVLIDEKAEEESKKGDIKDNEETEQDDIDFEDF